MEASDGNQARGAQLEGLALSVRTRVGDSHGDLGWCFAVT